VQAAPALTNSVIVSVPWCVSLAPKSLNIQPVKYPTRAKIKMSPQDDPWHIRLNLTAACKKCYGPWRIFVDQLKKPTLTFNIRKMQQLGAQFWQLCYFFYANHRAVKYKAPPVAKTPLQTTLLVVCTYFSACHPEYIQHFQSCHATQVFFSGLNTVGFCHSKMFVLGQWKQEGQHPLTRQRAAKVT